MKNILISILFLSNLCLAQVSVTNNPNFIAGQNTTQTLRKPGSTENGKVISWDNVLKKYNLITNSSGGTPLTLNAATISSTQINLSWNNGAYDTYTLQRADNAAFTTNLTTLYTGANLNYQNTGLSKNFTYYYRLKGTLSGNDTQFFTTTSTTFSIDLLSGQNLYTFGDSYTTGQAASPTSNSYAELFKSYTRSTRTNYAAGGKGMYYVASLANSSITPANTGIYTCMIGFNDYRRSGVNAKTDEKIRGGHRVFLMNALGKKFYQANTFTQTGTWANIGPGAFGNKYAVPNNSGSGTLTTTISGKNFGISFLGSSGSTYTFGNLTITVDGTTVFNSSMNNKTDGISDGVYNNEVTPYGIFVTGLSTGSHTFVFTSTIQTPIDYIVELPDVLNEYCNTVLVARPCKNPPAGYAVSPSNGSNSIMDAAATIIQNVVTELSSVGYPVKYIDTDVLILDTTSGDFDPSDPVHPTNQGHNKLFNAFKSNLNLSSQDLVFNNSNGQLAYFNGAYVSRGVSTWDAFAGSDYFLPINTDGYVEFSVPNLTDSDFGMIGWNTTKESSNYPNYEYGIANYAGSIYKLLNGGGFASVQSGPLTVNSKARLERASGVVKIRYASDGVTFSDVYTFGTDNQRFYLNLNMDASPKKLYGLNTSGFIKQDASWKGSGNTFTNSSNVYGNPNFIEGVTIGGTTLLSNLTTNGIVTTSGGTGTLGVTAVLPIANGGTGTATPALVAGTNVSITGSWPNQTINASGGGITNTAANTEIAQSNGTNLIGSKMYVDTNGNLTVGSSILSSGDISITASSSTLKYNFSLVSLGTISQKNIYISPPVNNSLTGNVSNVSNTFIGDYNLNLVNGSLINVTLYFSGIQTSGTLGATGFSYQINATFRKSSNTWTRVGTSNIISSANDTGDVFGTPTLTGGTGIDLTYSFNTTKTLAISFNTTYVRL